MSAPLELPLTLRELSPEILNWLLIKSAQSGKNTAEVVKEIIETAKKKSRPSQKKAV